MQDGEQVVEKGTPTREREICSKLITPALQNAGWNLETQIREERPLTDGRGEVRGSQILAGRVNEEPFFAYPCSARNAAAIISCSVRGIPT